MTPTRPEISLVVTVHDEAAALARFDERLATFLPAGIDAELIVVDDASTDGTLAHLRSIAAREPRCRVVSLARSVGRDRATFAGLDRARGRAVVTLRLEHPVEVVHALVGKWREGFDVVYARAFARPSGLAERIYEGLMADLVPVGTPLDTGDLRLLSRRVVRRLKKLGDRHRFVRGMPAWLGFKQTAIEHVAAGPRRPFRALLRSGVDAVLSFSGAPLRLAFYFGGVAVVATVLFLLVALSFSISRHGVPSWLVTVTAGSFFTALQLLALGVMGAYVARIHEEVKGRPLYVVAERLNFGGQTAVRPRLPTAEFGSQGLMERIGTSPSFPPPAMPSAGSAPPPAMPPASTPPPAMPSGPPPPLGARPIPRAVGAGATIASYPPPPANASRPPPAAGGAGQAPLRPSRPSMPAAVVAPAVGTAAPAVGTATPGATNAPAAKAPLPLPSRTKTSIPPAKTEPKSPAAALKSKPPPASEKKIVTAPMQAPLSAVAGATRPSPSSPPPPVAPDAKAAAEAPAPRSVRSAPPPPPSSSASASTTHPGLPPLAPSAAAAPAGSKGYNTIVGIGLAAPASSAASRPEWDQPPGHEDATVTHVASDPRTLASPPPFEPPVTAREPRATVPDPDEVADDDRAPDSTPTAVQMNPIPAAAVRRHDESSVDEDSPTRVGAPPSHPGRS